MGDQTIIGRAQLLTCQIFIIPQTSTICCLAAEKNRLFSSICVFRISSLDRCQIGFQYLFSVAHLIAPTGRVTSWLTSGRETNRHTQVVEEVL